MRTWLKRFREWYFDVQIDDPLRQQRLEVFLTLILVLEIISALNFLNVSYYATRLFMVALVLTFMVGCAGLAYYARRKHRWPPYVFLFLLMLITGWVFRDHMDGPSVLVYVIPVMIAPLIARPWIAFPVAAVQVIWIYWNNATSGSAQNIGITVLLFFAIFGIVSWLSSANFVRVFKDMRLAAYSLTNTNRELEEGRRQLEVNSQELQRRTGYLEAVAQVTREMSLQLSLNGVLDRVVQLVADHFALSHAAIYLLDVAGEWAVMQSVSSPGGRRMLSRGHRVQVGLPGLIGYAVRSGTPQIITDTQSGAGWQPDPELPDMRSVLVLPLRVGERILGVLDLQDVHPGMFTEAYASILQILADQISVAIENARLFQQLQESLAARRVAYGELDRESWAQLLREQPDLGYISNDHGSRRLDMVGVTEEASMAPLMPVVGKAQDGKFPLLIPVKVSSGQVIGMMGTYKLQDAGEWSDEEISLLTALAEQLGVALESARFYRDSQRRAVREQITRHITSQMRSTLVVDTVLQTAVREISEALGLHDLTIRLTEGM